jgi:hypothetical protein
MKEQRTLADFPDWAEINASVDRAQAELQKIKRRKREVEQKLVSLKLPKEKASEWSQFTGGASESLATEVKLRDEYAELEEQEHFLGKAVNQGRAELDRIVDGISLEICNEYRAQFVA